MSNWFIEPLLEEKTGVSQTACTISLRTSPTLTFSLFRNSEQPGITSCDPHWHKWFIFSMSVWTHRNNRVLLTVPTVQQLNCVHSVTGLSQPDHSLLLLFLLYSYRASDTMRLQKKPTKEKVNKNIYFIQSRWFFPFKKFPQDTFSTCKDNLTSPRLYICCLNTIYEGKIYCNMFVCFF